MAKRKKEAEASEQAEAKEHKKNWRETRASAEDIQNFLCDNILLRHNVISGEAEFRVPMKDEFDALGWIYPTGANPLDEWRSAVKWQNVNDRLVNSLWNMLSMQKDVSDREIWRVIRSDFVPLYNPFTNYLSRLPPWDEETNPILELAMTVNVKGGTEEQLLFYVCLRKWLVAMVAGWLEEEKVNQEILVFVGRQGIYKTTWFNHLLPPELESYFHSNTSFGNMTKDEVLRLSQYGLICCEELDTMRPSEMNRLKWAVTTTVTDERKPYAHSPERRVHIASYCGTGNNVRFIDDDTGTRRWLPFEVESIQSPHEFPINHEAIFAQAYALYLRGFRYWFEEGPETELQSRHNERFEVPQYEHDLILTHYRVPKGGEAGEFVSSGDIMQTISGSLRLDLSENKLGRIMRKLGFVNGRSGNLRGFRVIAYKPEEIQANRRLRALEAVEDTCALTMEEIYAVYGGEGEGATNAALF